MGSLERKTSRTNLQIDSKPFMAKPYLQFLHSLRTDRKTTLDESKMSRKSNKSPDLVQLDQERLFMLPQFNKQNKLKRSNVSLGS